MSKISNHTSPLEGAVKAVNLLVQQKILFGKHDEVALVLCGTQETNNNLKDKGYDNITVARDISPPDLELLKMIEKIEPEGAEADLIDALIVGMDLFIQKQQADPKKNFAKRIFLVTDAGCPINSEDINVVVSQFSKMEAKLNVIGIDFDDEDAEPMPNKEETKRDNEELLQKVASEVGGVIVPVNQAIEMMSYFRSKGVLQRSTFRGLLEIGSKLKIPVWSFLKTMEQKFPSLTKLSVVSQEGGMGVAMERTYHSINDPDTEIPLDERVKGYKYGKTLVPFSKVDESVLKYQADSCMKVIGFTNSRHHFMGNVECIIANPTDKAAGTALSAIINALAETDSIAIVRYVKRAKSIPHLGALYPNIKAEYECLYYTSLPFAEDLRQYPFASLAPERTRKAFVPTAEQASITDELIKSLDLMQAALDEDGHPMESLKPKYTYNPVLQRFYQSVQHRALHPQTPLPKLDPVIEKYVNPDKELFHKAKPALQNFKEKFPIAKSEEVKEKNDRIYWKDSLTNQIKLDSYVPDPSKKRKMDDEYGDLSMESLISSGVSEVGAIKPVEDFKEMLTRRDIDLVDRAIEGMKKRLLQLVNDSVLDQLYPKALDCLSALRAGCIQEEESSTFNEFLKEIRVFYEGKRRDDFWKLIVKKNLSLIHFDESEDSNVSPEEANKFFSSAKKDVVVEAKQSKEEDEVDDLFAMVE